MKKYLCFLICVSSFLLVRSQEFAWANGFGSSGFDRGESINVDSLGNVYTVGTFKFTVDFDPGVGVFNMTSLGEEDIFITKMDSLGNFLWAKQIGGPSIDNNPVITFDAFGNLFLIGQFVVTVDFDPGLGVFNLTSNGSHDIFVLKLNSQGEFLWVKQIGGTGVEYGLDIKVGSSNNIYGCGGFSGTCDFDPGSTVFNMTAFANIDICFFKLDSAGNFIWAKKSGYTGHEEAASMVLDTFENLYLAGTFQTTVDFDPGVGVYSMAATGGYDCFVSKFNSGGNFIWAKKVGGYNDDFVQEIVLDNAGNIYTTGSFMGFNVDFDPGPGFHTLSSSAGGNDIYIQKLDSLGNLIWVKRIGGNGADKGFSLVLDKSNFLYTTGFFQATVDFDPEGYTSFQTSAGSYDVFILKLDSLGRFIWVRTFGSNGSDMGRSIYVDHKKNIYSTGRFSETVDFDCGPGVNLVSSSNNTEDAYIFKWSYDKCLDLKIQIDSFSNVMCNSVGFAKAHAIFGLPPYNYVWNTVPPVNDSIVAFNTAAVYEVSVSDANSCTRSFSLLVNEPADSGIDLSTNLVASTLRHGFQNSFWLNFYNDGCDPISGNVQFIFDAQQMAYISAVPQPSTIIGDTLIWNFNDLTYDSVGFIPKIKFTTLADIGDSICVSLVINPFAGDADTVNNIKTYCFPVIGAYDPNDKQVYPQGKCSQGYIFNEQLLTYTVRFQNTGNASAINIFVIDSLNSNLDISTVKVIGYSHPVVTQMLPGNVLRFNFDNIVLADSSSNEGESHGYVVFEINPFPNLPVGTLITNQVGIYFDFNAPVYTNSVLNTITDGVFDVTVSANGAVLTADLNNVSYQWMNCDNGLEIIDNATNQSYTVTTSGKYAVIVSDGCNTDTSSCINIMTTELPGLTGNLLFFYPNPASEIIVVNTQIPAQIEIINLLGEVVLNCNVKNKSQIDISSLAQGIYFMKIYDRYTYKFVKE